MILNRFYSRIHLKAIPIKRWRAKSRQIIALNAPLMNPINTINWISKAGTCRLRSKKLLGPDANTNKKQTAVDMHIRKKAIMAPTNREK